MIAGLKPYAEYKESGLPWLGQVPAHWEVRKPRHIGSLLKGVGGTKEDALPAGVPCVRYGELYTTHAYFVRRPKTFIHADRAADYTPLHYGDVLFAASGETLEDIGKSAVNLIDGTAVCGGDVIILRPTVPAHAPFLGYVMDCRPLANQKATMGRGTTVKHVYPDELKHLVFPLPPVPEQAAIVRFLDWANGRLERAIRAKRTVIALLNEQKQAIIHRAVTRGLDASVRFKPSGIPWLGDIPQHWQVMPIKRTCSLVRDGTHLPPPRTLTGFPLLSVRNIVGGRLVRRPDDSFISKADFEQLNSSFVVRQNDVLMAIVGATLGKVAVVEDIGPLQIQRSVSILRPRSELMSHAFLATFLRSPRLQQHLWKSVAFSAQPGIYLNFVANIPVPVPPTIAEQVFIFDGLQRELSPIDIASSRLEREIELLGEYRTRLVADVVTGKLDVREAAARLPEDAAFDNGDSEPGLDPELADEAAEA